MSGNRYRCPQDSRTDRRCPGTMSVTTVGANRDGCPERTYTCSACGRVEAYSCTVYQGRHHCEATVKVTEGVVPGGAPRLVPCGGRPIERVPVGDRL